MIRVTVKHFLEIHIKHNLINWLTIAMTELENTNIEWRAFKSETATHNPNNFNWRLMMSSSQFIGYDLCSL